MKNNEKAFSMLFLAKTMLFDKKEDCTACISNAIIFF